MAFCMTSSWIWQGELLEFCLSHHRGPGFGISRPHGREWEESTHSKVIFHFPCSPLPRPSPHPLYEKFSKWDHWEINSITFQKTSVGECGPVESFAGGFLKIFQGEVCFSIQGINILSRFPTTCFSWPKKLVLRLPSSCYIQSASPHVLLGRCGPWPAALALPGGFLEK